MIEEAYRIVFADPPREEHFRSHRYLNKSPGPVGDECRYASCSLFLSDTRARKFADLPKVKPKGPLIAKLAIPEGAGKSVTKRGHVDLWIYDDFSPLSAVISVEHL